MKEMKKRSSVEASILKNSIYGEIDVLISNISKLYNWEY